MKIQEIAVDKLKPYDKNAKKHPDEQVARIAASLREFGFQQPIVIDKDNVIIIGHGRLTAAKSIGMAKVPCVRVENLTQEQIRALRLAAFCILHRNVRKAYSCHRCTVGFYARTGSISINARCL